MKLKKKIGGYLISDNNKIEKFLAIIIIGYFGIKIVYSLFLNFYSDKYYFKNITINTNEENKLNITKNITLNAYVPGLWNNELNDFITLLVLSAIIFIFTDFSNKNFVDQLGNLNPIFLTGYIIGLGYPPMKVIFKRCFQQLNINENIFNILYKVLFIVFLIFIIYINFISGENKINYLVYLTAIILIIAGLILTRKQTISYGSISYSYNRGESCSFDKKQDVNTILQMSGENINLTITFIIFVALLLFTNEPDSGILKYIYIFLYALLLGFLVSDISYFGFQYFLEKTPLQECNNFKDCVLKDFNELKINSNLVNDLENDAKNAFIKIKDDAIEIKDKIDNEIDKPFQIKSFIKMVIFIILILIILYLIYFYYKKMFI